MDYNELLFALQMRQIVITDLERSFPEQMSGFYRAQTIQDHFDGFLIDALDEVEQTANAIKQARAT